jgi:hypothetical protein
MIQSRHEKCVWYVFPGALYEGKSMAGGWYFTDETESFGGGPYVTEKEAIEELNKYAVWLNRSVEEDFIKEITDGAV